MSLTGCVCVCQIQADWEAVSLELEQWAVCVRQLEDVLALQTLLWLPSPLGPAGGAPAQCCAKSLHEGGRGGHAPACLHSHTLTLSLTLTHTL